MRQTTVVTEDKTYVHAATALQLKSWRYLFAFLRLSGKIQKRLQDTPGYVRHSLRTNLFRVTFRTYSVYESHEAVQDLVYSPEHVEAMRKMGEWSGPESRTTNWTRASPEIDWKDGLRRLAETPPYTQRQAGARA